MQDTTRQFQPTRTAPLSAFTARRQRLPYGRRRGSLKIGPNRPTGRDSRIFAACDCGHTGWYTEEALWHLLNHWESCAEPGCTKTPLRDRIWQSPDSLKMQLFYLTLFHPEEVQSAWGGTLDDLYVTSLEEGAIKLSDYLTSTQPEGAWVGRYDLHLPFIEGNVRLQDLPDPLLKKAERASLLVDGERFTLKELCGLGNTSPGVLLMWIYERGGTDDLIADLI